MPDIVAVEQRSPRTPATAQQQHLVPALARRRDIVMAQRHSHLELLLLLVVLVVGLLLLLLLLQLQLCLVLTLVRV